MTRVAVPLVMGLALSVLAADPMTGSWKQNPAKGSFSPQPQITITRAENGLKFAWNTGVSITAVLDGADRPAPVNTAIDSTSFRRIDSRTIEEVGKRKGQTAMTIRWTVSPDGSALLQRSRGKHENGTAFDSESTGRRVAAGSPDEPFAGVWQFDNRTRPAVPQNLTIAIEGDRMEYKSSMGLNFSAPMDAKEHPVEGVRSVQTVTLERLNGNAVKAVYRDSDGHVARTVVIEAVAGGRGLTQTTDGALTGGKQFHSVTVFDRAN